MKKLSMNLNWISAFAGSKENKEANAIYNTADEVETIPNRAADTGDKHPSTGQSAQKELDAWHKGNKEYEKAKKIEDKGSKSFNSNIMNNKAKTEDVEMIMKENDLDHLGTSASRVKLSRDRKVITADSSDWRAVLADFTIEKKPDGGVKVNFTEAEPEVPEPTQPATSQPSQTQSQSQSQPQQTVDNNAGTLASITAAFEAFSEIVNTPKILRQHGTNSLIQVEGKTHHGIGIIDSKTGSIRAFNAIEHFSHPYGETIAKGVWETQLMDIPQSNE